MVFSALKLISNMILKSQLTSLSLVPFTHCLDYLNFMLYRAEMVYLIVLFLA